jgi:hypothetical protein
MITCHLDADYLILLRLIEIQCFLSQFCVVAKVVIIKEKNWQNLAIQQVCKDFFFKRILLCFGSLLEHIIKIWRLEKNSSKANEELTN